MLIFKLLNNDKHFDTQRRVGLLWLLNIKSDVGPDSRAICEIKKKIGKKTLIFRQ